MRDALHACIRVGAHMRDALHAYVRRRRSIRLHRALKLEHPICRHPKAHAAMNTFVVHPGFHAICCCDLP